MHMAIQDGRELRQPPNETLGAEGTEGGGSQPVAGTGRWFNRCMSVASWYIQRSADHTPSDAGRIRPEGCDE